MRTFLALAALFIAACSAAMVVAASQEEMMKEMKDCAVCGVMASDPKLMKDMTWETHKIDNGMLCVASVPKEDKADFDAVHAKMMANIAKVKAEMAQGKEVKVCSFCREMGELEKAGAKQQPIATQTGSVMLITSTDPSVVAKIHAHADKAIEMEKQMQSQQQN